MSRLNILHFNPLRTNMGGGHSNFQNEILNSTNPSFHIFNVFSDSHFSWWTIWVRNSLGTITLRMNSKSHFHSLTRLRHFFLHFPMRQFGSGVFLCCHYVLTMLTRGYSVDDENKYVQRLYRSVNA